MSPDTTVDEYWRSLDESDPAEQEGGIVVGALLLVGAVLVVPALAWHQLLKYLHQRG